MPLSVVLLALALAPPSKGGPIKGAPGKNAPPKTPPKASSAPSPPALSAPTGLPATSEEIAGWGGWKLGSSPVPVEKLPYLFSAELPQPPPESPGATVFRLKVFLLRRSESLGSKEELRPAATVISSQDEVRARRAVQNLDAIVRQVSGNKMRLETSISLDEDGLGLSEAAATYARYRINGGKFDAEDGIDRGPYSGVMVLGPLLKEETVEANGTPVATVDLYRAGLEQTGTELENSLFQAWLAMVNRRAPVVGNFGTIDRREEFDVWPNYGGWFTPARQSALRAEGIATEDIEAKSAGDEPPSARLGSPRGPYLAPAGVWIESDPERGTALRYREGSYERGGGFFLPNVAAPAGKNLAFWVRHATTDPIAFSAAGSTVVLGEGGSGESSVSLPSDGKWHRVVVVPGKGMSLGPPPSLMGRMRRDNSVVNLWLADFEWTDDAPSASSPSARAARLAALPTASPAEKIAALASGDSAMEYVALETLDPETPGFEEATVPLLNEINAVVARRAAKALAKSKNPATIAALKRAVTLGPSESVRQEAAMALAQSGDVSLVPTLAILLGRPNWRSRLAGVQALGLFRQSNAIRFRLSATLQDNPEIRYAALAPAGLDDPDERQKLLYAAINDPADEVRVLASDKLLDSKDPAVQSEGLRAAADDSAWVRARMQESFARRKDPAFRDAILKGTGDASPTVRAAAVHALGALGALDPATAPNLFTDAHSAVLAALVAEESAGRVKLPESTKALLRASQDPRVRRP